MKHSMISLFRITIIIAFSLCFIPQSFGQGCPDRDGDGICDSIDPCPDFFNTNLTDSDGDGIWDECDNCPGTANSGQEDFDLDGIGDACDLCNDTDYDGVCDPNDICQGSDDTVDVDQDGIPDGCDNAIDLDGDGIVDICWEGSSCDDGDFCTVDDRYDGDCRCQGDFEDSDGDGICNTFDKCPGYDDSLDFDNDGIPNGCDTDASCATCKPDDKGKVLLCRIPLLNPSNLMEVYGSCSELTAYFNADGSFKNAKDHCGPCTCADSGSKDSDGDGVCDDKDQCPDNPNLSVKDDCGCEPNDRDEDGVCDALDQCEGDDLMDQNENGLADACEKCIVNGKNTHEWIEKLRIKNKWYEGNNDQGYVDFSSDPIKSYQFENPEIEIYTEFIEAICQVSVAVYVDWNQDNDFSDPGEELIYGYSTGVFLSNIKIPNTVQAGVYHLRVIMDYGRIEGACDPIIFGEVEDYLLEILDNSLCINQGESFSQPATMKAGELENSVGFPFTFTSNTAINAQIVNGSLESKYLNTGGNKLAILNYPSTDVELETSYPFNNLEGQAIWVSFIYKKTAHECGFELTMNGEKFCGLSGDDSFSLFDEKMSFSNTNESSSVIMQIIPGVGTKLWLNKDPQNLDSPDLQSDKTVNLNSKKLSMSIRFFNTESFFPAVQYLDEFRISCQQPLKETTKQRTVKANKLGIGLIISPNPIGNESTLNISLKDSKSLESDIRLLNEMGQAVLNQKLYSTESRVNISKLSPGIYILELTNGTERMVEKLVVE